MVIMNNKNNTFCFKQYWDCGGFEFTFDFIMNYNKKVILFFINGCCSLSCILTTIREIYRFHMKGD